VKKPNPMDVETALERARQGYKNDGDAAILAAEVERLRKDAPRTKEQEEVESVKKRVDLALIQADQGWHSAVSSAVYEDAVVLAAEVRRVRIEAESWKKRAAQHGCNTEEGDHECG
jgi:hypothetical protein